MWYCCWIGKARPPNFGVFDCLDSTGSSFSFRSESNFDWSESHFESTLFFSLHKLNLLRLSLDKVYQALQRHLGSVQYYWALCPLFHLTSEYQVSYVLESFALAQIETWRDEKPSILCLSSLKLMQDLWFQMERESFTKPACSSRFHHFILLIA